MTEAAKPAWAGFWRRLFAYLVDALLLAGLGLAAGTLLFDQLAAIPGPTRLIGGAVGLLYFGLLSSGAGGSATLGMRLLGLRVTSMRGRPLNLPTAFWRALMLQAPLTLNGLTLQPSEEPLFNQVFFVVAATLVFGVILAQIVLLLFNAPSRRLVHDLLSGSAVVRRRSEGPLPTHRSVAQAIALLLVLAALGGATYWIAPFGPGGAVQQKIEQRLQPLLVTQQAVAALPGVMEASVNDNTHTSTSDGTTTVTRTLIVTARVSAWPKDERKEADRIAEAVLAVHDFAPGQNLQVTLRHGYDIGISGFWRSYWNTYPTETAAPVADPAPAGPEAPAGEPAARPATAAEPEPEPAKASAATPATPQPKQPAEAPADPLRRSRTPG